MMTVTELAVLTLNSGVTLPSPELSPHFALLASRQSAWSGYPLRFYNQGNKILLVSGWEDVPAHRAWIASEGNQELLKLLQPHLSIEMLVHLDLPFEQMPDWRKLVLSESDVPDAEHTCIIAGDVEGNDERRWRIAKTEKDSKDVWIKIDV